MYQCLSPRFWPCSTVGSAQLAACPPPGRASFSGFVYVGAVACTARTTGAAGAAVAGGAPTSETAAIAAVNRVVAMGRRTGLPHILVGGCEERMAAVCASAERSLRRYRVLCLALDHRVLDLRDGLRDLDAARACLRAVEGGAAAPD